MISHHYSIRAAGTVRSSVIAKRWSSVISSERLARPVQSYISSSHDPHINLSIEHHLLQKAGPETAILFLYVNRPSIIIGRNQNPWLEVNLALLNLSRDRSAAHTSRLGCIDLVRRRSGGGTVFHDEGNVNWTIISPSTSFTRDKHAEMVVRGLRSCGVDRARVNERHDIVLDQGDRTSDLEPSDTHATAYQSSGDGRPQSLKVSGSAYKLTRNRALHHGTCLLASPNLNFIPQYLHSPAKPFITARGVESVSSPVGNIRLPNDQFIAAVQREFATMYGPQADLRVHTLGEECLEEAEVRKGYDELKSKEWTYLQTPQFTLSTRASADVDVDLELTARYGAITQGTLHRRGRKRQELGDGVELAGSMVGQRIHEIESWGSLLTPPLQCVGHVQSNLPIWLEQMLPRI